jgi:ParB-like chromosome segregation protein Spo0J
MKMAGFRPRQFFLLFLSRAISTVNLKQQEGYIMKVKIKDLQPNPFRNTEHYPINREKVESLKASIQETTFWDNILARKADGKFQLAYGHHRLKALQELGTKEIDIPVKDLDDTTMLKIMANENMEEWGSNPSIIKETVRVAKGYLDGELDKYESWEQFKESDLINLLEQKTEKAFNKVKAGVGQTTLLKFLGEPWKQSRIQEALATLKDEQEGKLDREAVETFDNQSKAKAFREKVIHYGVPIRIQRRVAQEMVQDGLSAKLIKRKMYKYLKEPPRFKEMERAAEQLHREMFKLLYPDICEHAYEIQDLSEHCSEDFKTHIGSLIMFGYKLWGHELGFDELEKRVLKAIKKLKEESNGRQVSEDRTGEQEIGVQAYEDGSRPEEATAAPGVA